MQFSIDRKIDSIDQKCLWLIQQQSGINQTMQIQDKILIAILICRETDSVDQKSKKKEFWKTGEFYAETPQNIVFYE